MLDQTDFNVCEASKRFITVRTQNNLTQDKLAEILGIAVQTVKNYEKAGSQNVRDPANGDRVNAIAGMKIETLFKMAQKLNISADYLLGLSDDPSRTPAATDDLHISAKAVQQLRFFACGEKHADELSLLMEDRLFWSIIREVIAFKKATIAEGILDSLRFKYYVSDEASCLDEMEAASKMEEEIYATISDESIDETTRQYLSSLIYLNNLNGTEGQFADDAYVRYFVVPSEIHEQRANKYLHLLIERVNPENPIHGLRRVFNEAASAGHVSYDHSGNAHYSSRKQSGDNNGND